MTFTQTDMRNQVNTALGRNVSEYDVDAIVDAIQADYGTIDIDDVPGEKFWGLVTKFDVSASPVKVTPTDRTAEIMTAAAGHIKNEVVKLIEGNANRGHETSADAITSLIDAIHATYESMIPEK